MRGQTNASNIGGTVGSDTKPIKIVNSIPIPVAYNLLSTVGGQKVDSGMIIIHNAPISSGDNRFFDGFERADGVRIADFYLSKTATGYAMTLRIMNDQGQWSYFNLGNN